MSQATIARKERRKRYIAKLKQHYDNTHDNTHVRQQNVSQAIGCCPVLQEIIAATQQACIASFTQGCDYAKTICCSAFQDGFLAGNKQANTSHANTAHASTQTVDVSYVNQQTDCTGLPRPRTTKGKARGKNKIGS